ncbi:MAG: DEAD/DEAH box helicase, partial [Granulosicoccaceae bacterium]
MNDAAGGESEKLTGDALPEGEALSHAVPSFAELGVAEVLCSALRASGLSLPTQVQQVSIPEVLNGSDLMVGAETGSGKTLAFLLPTLMRLADASSPERAIVLAPTRELAKQISEVAAPLAEAMGVDVRLVIGGEDFKVQQRTLRAEGGLWVATPGRLDEQLEAQPQLLSQVSVLILDEADRMLDMGFAEIVLKLAAACPAERQGLLFSATLSGGAMRRVKEAVLSQPKRLVLNDPRKAQSAIRHQVVTADDDAHKLALLAWLAKHHDGGCILAFCKSRERAQVFGDKLQAMGVRATSLHGELDTKQRQRAVRLLRESTVQVMVATDVAARGLDVAELSLVINVDMPRRAHQYIHRVGRTGRAGAAG